MKKFASLLLTVVLLAAMLTVFAVPAFTEGETESVNKPEGAEWLVDEGDNYVWYKLTENGTGLAGDSTGLTLTVGGTGKMPDFENEYHQPWNYAVENITAIEIASGVTSIGNYAFSNYGLVRTLTIPDRVKNIGAFAFKSCGSLDEVTIPGSVESIGKNAFSECLPTLVINGLYGSAAEKYARENGVAFKGTGTCSHIFCLVCDSCKDSVTKSDLLNAWGYSTATGSTLSEGSLTVICSVAAAVVFGLGGFILGTKKKKKPALASGENKDEE